MNREISWNVSDSMLNEMLTIQQELSFPNMKDLITQAVQRYISDIRRESWLMRLKNFNNNINLLEGKDMPDSKIRIKIDWLEEKYGGASLPAKNPTICCQRNVFRK
jgi:hypothetical protein